MKLERVSEYQISCTLSGFDLIERNMELGELAYGSQKARQLLREMMQRASSELGFEVDNMPLRVESIPLSDDSIQVRKAEAADMRLRRVGFVLVRHSLTAVRRRVRRNGPLILEFL